MGRRRCVRMDAGLLARAQVCADALGVPLGVWVGRVCRWVARRGWDGVSAGCGEDGGKVVSLPGLAVLEGRTGREIAGAVELGVRWCEERRRMGGSRGPDVLREAGFAFRRDGTVV